MSLRSPRTARASFSFIPSEGFKHHTMPRADSIKGVWQLRNYDCNHKVAVAISRLAVHDGRVLERDGRAVVVEAFEDIAQIRRSDNRQENILDFLERCKDQTRLGRALETEIWIELIHRVVWARDKYLRQTPTAQIKAERTKLPPLALAADKLYDAAEMHDNEWDWLALEIYNDPMLNGNLNDNELDEDDA